MEYYILFTVYLSQVGSLVYLKTYAKVFNVTFPLRRFQPSLHIGPQTQPFKVNINEPKKHRHVWMYECMCMCTPITLLCG